MPAGFLNQITLLLVRARTRDLERFSHQRRSGSESWSRLVILVAELDGTARPARVLSAQSPHVPTALQSIVWARR
jgi:hypothetical protein